MRRFQSQLPDNRRYRRVFPTLAAIIREEGWRGVYRGFAPKALRLGIGQTVRRLSGFACLPACLTDCLPARWLPVPPCAGCSQPDANMLGGGGPLAACARAQVGLMTFQQCLALAGQPASASAASAGASTHSTPLPASPAGLGAGMAGAIPPQPRV